MTLTVDELRTLLADLPGDAVVTVRHDYRYAPVTSAVFDEHYPTVCLSADLTGVEARFE